MKKFNKSAGQVSKLLLVLAVIVLVAAIITFLVMKMAEKPAAPKTPTGNTIPTPVYEQTLGNIRFVFEDAVDEGNTLSASDVTNSRYGYSGQPDLKTTEKFIEVTIGAQNQGTENTDENAWDIVDSQGRNFVPEETYTVNPWLPNPNLCGALLKPAFNPTPCTKIYEVSKESTGLRVQVETGVDNSANNLSSGKIDSASVDLIVK
jgi:hypothetical protein